MAYRAAANRANSKSPTGVSVESHGRGVKLNINTDLSGQLNGEASTFKPAKSANQWLLYGSTPDADNEPIKPPLIVRSDNFGNKANGTMKTIPTPIGTMNGISPTRAKINFTTDVVPGKFFGSHYIKVQLNREMYTYVFGELDMAFDWKKNMRTFIVVPEPEGKKMTTYIVFDDVRRTATASDHVNLVDSTADVEYVTQQEFAAAQKEVLNNYSAEAAGRPSLCYDGQVMFYGKFDGPVTACKADGLEDRVRGLGEQFGDVLAIGELDAKNGMARFRVEFYSIKAAKEAVKNVTAAHPADLGGWLVFAQELPEIGSTTSSDKGTGAAGRGTPFGSADGESPTFVSPTGRTTWMFDKATGEVLSTGNNGSDRTSPANGGATAITMQPVHAFTPPMQVNYNTQHQGDLRHGPLAVQQYSPGPYVYQHSQHYAGNTRESFGRGRNEFADSSQVVDIENIRRGLDVRTTIMLRNLPNQMSCHRLKELLDACVFGLYDFTYVRIDYKKGMSVGYGFVNFHSPLAIIMFLEFCAGRPWMPELPNRRGAARLAEVSYATVQGYDCCIEKFRNSSVMTEFPDYRPKLWYTKDSAPTEEQIGTEVDFPPVNNTTKHQRSLANASQIGLFPPQSRRGPGGQHRPVRSQYDRGTTAQQQEDAMHQFQQQFHQMQLMPAPQYNGNGPQLMAPGQGAYMMPPMPPMMQQQAPFGGVIGQDPYGNPIFANAGAVMAPNGFYGQMPMSPQYMNGNGFGGHATPGPRFARRGYQGGNRAAAVPRSFDNHRYDAEEDPNAYQGDVDVGQMTGYYNPMSAKKTDK